MQINSRIQVTLLKQHGKDGHRHKKSLNAMLAIQKSILSLIKKLNEALATHGAKSKLLIKAADDKDQGLKEDVPADPKGQRQGESAGQ